MDNFSEEMTASKKSSKQKYQANDADIAEKLSKAKNINKNILKSTHPEEYQKQIDEEAKQKAKEEAEKKKKEEEEKQYKKMV